MPGFANGILRADNVNFTTLTGVPGKVATITADGQLLVGSTVAPQIRTGTITSSDSSITIGYASPNITLAIAGGTTVLKTLTGNSGGPLSPTSGNINTLGTGSITVAGVGSTQTTQLTGLTQYAVLIGAGTATITKVGPVASTGAVLMSNGIGSDPGFSTATYPLTTTVSQILYSSATNTVAGLATANNGVLIASNTGVPSMLAAGATGQVLTATTGAPPSWAAAGASGFTSIVTRVFTSDGTYTPTSGMDFCIVEVCGSGAGGGGIPTPGAGQIASAGGGGAGGYARIALSAATIGASQAVTIGVGGAGGAAGVNNGASGNTSSLGTLCIAGGGLGGLSSNAAAVSQASGGAGGAGSTGTLLITGGTGESAGGIFADTLSLSMAGAGGVSFFGGGGLGATAINNSSAGGAGAAYGSGGGGATAAASQTQQAGGAGAGGVIVITEFI